MKVEDEENKSDEKKSKGNIDSILQYFTKVLGNSVKSVKISKKLTGTYTTGLFQNRARDKVIVLKDQLY